MHIVPTATAAASPPRMMTKLISAFIVSWILRRSIATEVSLMNKRHLDETFPPSRWRIQRPLIVDPAAIARGYRAP